MTPAQPAESYNKPVTSLEVLYAIAHTNGQGGAKSISLLSDADQSIHRIIVPHVTNLRFEVDGIPFCATHKPAGTVSQLAIWGTLGYMPYSVNSARKRKNMIRVLEAARQLPNVKIGIDRETKILVMGEYTISTPPTPVYLFEPLTQFLQESRPFIQLVAEFL